jgi:hypothetical protein
VSVTVGYRVEKKGHTLVEKLARTRPRLITRTPVKVIILILSVLAMRGLTKMLPLQVKPLPIVPTKETSASRR